MKKRVLIVDDHAAVRHMLAAVLTREPEYDVVGEAGSGLRALELCGRLSPDVVVLDLVLPELCGIEVLRRLHEDKARSRVLIFSGSLNQVQIVQALKCHPHGFVEKSDTLQTFREALRAVAGGGVYLTAYASALLADVRSQDSLDLTRREQEILQLVAESRSSKEIAARLGIAVKTVENHRAHVMDKLHLHDVAALTRYAVRTGLVN